MFDLESVRQAAERNIPINPGDYEKDGLMYCCKCNTPKQVLVELPWRSFIAPCLCACQVEAWDAKQAAEKNAERMEKIKRLRINGIQDSELLEMTFAVDDGKDAKKSDLARRYVTKWKELYKENVGLLFHGDTGNGKTFTAACIANALIEKGVPVLMTSCSKIVNHLSGMYSEDKINYLNSINHYDLLVLDDFGSERDTSFMLEQMYDIVDTRYKAKKPLIITTNLTMAELKNPKDINYKRIYSRILEMCQPIHFDGEDRRVAQAKEKLEKAKNILLSSD